MYELVILGHLMRGPMHGYLMAKIINDMIGPFARLSNGRLYPLLAQLQRDGLIAAVEDTGDGTADRQHRSFQITEAGRWRFHELMMDTTSNPGDYSRIFWIKLPHLHHLEPSERLYLLDHYINFCQTHLFHLANEMRDLERKARVLKVISEEQLEQTLYAMQHMRDRWQVELDGARTWRAREVAKMEGLEAPDNAPMGESEARHQPALPTGSRHEPSNSQSS
jgi:DNA-binding PadR family transcriptional regulator